MATVHALGNSSLKLRLNPSEVIQAAAVASKSKMRPVSDQSIVPADAYYEYTGVNFSASKSVIHPMQKSGFLILAPLYV